MRALSISIIVTTYNWPQALQQVLASLCHQTYPHFEVIVADDGSDTATRDVVHAFTGSAPFALKHLWHEDKGFRAAKIRNKAAAAASNDYLVFIDGDCFVGSDFVEQHARLATKKYFVAGQRILLNKAFTNRVLTENENLHLWGLGKWFTARMQGQINRWFSLLKLPLGCFRKIAKTNWKGAKTCNLALWREDFLRINGFDEKFEGWGFEDSDLVIRLIRAGIYRLSGKNAVAVFHLWHPEASREKMLKNRQYLTQTLAGDHIHAKKGVSQYLVSTAS